MTSRRLPTTQFLIQIAWVGASAQIGENNPFVTFPVLSCPFSSSNAQLKPRGQYSCFMAQMTWFGPGTVLLGVRMMSDIIWGKCALKTHSKGAWIGIFNPNCQNLKIAISRKPYIRSVQNLMTKLTPSTTRRGWSTTAVRKIQHYNMADVRHLEN